MVDHFDEVSSSRNWIERIAERLPGFSGYQNRETRRELDRLWRGRLAARVDEARKVVMEAIRKSSRGGNLEALGDFEAAEKRLDGLANQIRTADYGYSGYFDAVKIGEDQLEKIYDFDLAFDDEVGALAEIAEKSAEAGGEVLVEAVDKALSRWRDRKDLIHLVAGARG